MSIDKLLEEVKEEIEEASAASVKIAEKMEKAQSEIGGAMVSSAEKAIQGAAEAAVHLEEVKDHLLEGEAKK